MVSADSHCVTTMAMYGKSSWLARPLRLLLSPVLAVARRSEATGLQGYRAGNPMDATAVLVATVAS